jgi:hypothetical protein
MHKGINYDVGTVMGVNWRPDYNPTTVHRELEIIKNDLHCSAVGISGKDIGRIIATAEDALNQGLEAWLNPGCIDKTPDDTLAYIVEAAKATQPLHECYPGKVVFCVGAEFTLFMQGILPGKTFMGRVKNLRHDSAGIKEGKHNQALNDFLNKAAKDVRKVYGGQIMYRSLVWEQVDWNNFDIIGVDHYWGEAIKDQYIDMANPLFAYNKPVINTGFGFNTTNAPVTGMLSTVGGQPSILLHQLPIIGRFIRPKTKVVNERDEAIQAKRLIDNLKLLDKAGFSGTFIDQFIFPLYPYSDKPKYDLDRTNSSLVKYYEGGRHGMTYSDMTWEPKEAFKAVAKYYKQS